MKKEKLSLKLNKEVIHRLDHAQASEVYGGKVVFLSLWGSNCNNSDPNKHNCCTGIETVSGACVSIKPNVCP